MSAEDIAPESEAERVQQGQTNSFWFPAVPGPVKRVFDKFPLTTYPPNALPSRSPRRTEDHVLYIFTDAKGARHGAPSFNPQCLKWQVRDPVSGFIPLTAYHC